MLKKILKKLVPEKNFITDNKHISAIFGNLIHHPNLWHLNKYSVSRGFAIGLFISWVPLPMQMLFAAGCAIFFHANLPISVSLVWVSNPLTMPVFFFMAYKLGGLVMGIPVDPGLDFDLSIKWLQNIMSTIWKPFLLGSLLYAVLSSFLGYLVIRCSWRLFIVFAWRKRSKNRKLAKDFPR